MSFRNVTATLSASDNMLDRTRSRGVLFPLNEAMRLEALRSCEILESAPEETFDGLTRLASYICEVPIALISLVDSQRLWFKSKLGLQISEVQRESSFCQHAIMQNEVFEVEDAAKNDFFRINPLVTDSPNVRFYAGAPLINADGFGLGTICIFDTIPRQLSDRQRDALKILAREVVSHLEMRRASFSLREEKDRLESLIRLANSAVEHSSLANKSTIYVKQESKLIKICAPDILWIEALGDYINIHTCNDRFTVYATMKDMESKLLAHDFVRVHRKYIVRIDKITAIEDETVVIEKRDVSNAGHAMNGLMYIPIGSSFKSSLIKRLNLI